MVSWPGPGVCFWLAVGGAGEGGGGRVKEV